MGGYTYDTGALIAIERYQPRMQDLHVRATLRRGRITVPAPVVVEAWRGHAVMALLLRSCRIEVLDEAQAKAAGLILARCSLDVGAVDAVVVEGALRRGDSVISGNREHLLALADGVGQRLDVIDV